MANNYGSNSGDTMEFLALMGSAPAPAPAPAPRRSAAQVSNPYDSYPYGSPVSGQQAYGSHAPAPAPRPSARRSAAPAAVQPGAVTPEEPKPVVIKGGPRRVVRADGRQPQMSRALGQQRFEHASGREMFAPQKTRNAARETVMGVVALVFVAVLLLGCWLAANASVTKERQLDVVGTGDYDGSLSLTPANDGGYYTVFLVTSTKTDENQIGTLSQVVMHRTDKAVTTSTQVAVPTNLYVKRNSTTDPETLQAVLANSQSVTRALDGIDSALGIRLRNVVCCDEETFAKLAGIMDGSRAASSFDPQSLLGEVRSNLSLEGIVEFCGQVAAVGTANIRQMTVPTTALDVNGTIMAQATPATYSQALSTTLSLAVGGTVQYDAYGNYAGTQYDEWGNPILDANGAPLGALYDPNGNLVFDENGYVQFYGQQYDERGWPVGTKYDEYGNPILDQWGNPLGTQYNWDGSDYQYDWRGNIVIL